MIVIIIILYLFSFQYNRVKVNNNHQITANHFILNAIVDRLSSASLPSVHVEHTKSDSSIENAVITSCAKAFHRSDSSRRWEWGWLPANQTKPSCHSKAGAAMPSKSHLCLQIANMKHHFLVLAKKIVSSSLASLVHSVFGCFSFRNYCVYNYTNSLDSGVF